MLLFAQLVVVLAYPFLDGNVAGRAVVGVVQMAVVLIAVWAVRRTPALSWVAVRLGGPAMVFAILEAVDPDVGWIVLVSAAFHVPFYFFVSYAMVRYLFHDDKVTRDELYATGRGVHRRRVGLRLRLSPPRRSLWPGSFAGSEGTRPVLVRAPLPLVHHADQPGPVGHRAGAATTPGRW